MLGTCIMSSRHMARLHRNQDMQALPESIMDKRLVHPRDMCTMMVERLFHAIEMVIFVERRFEDGLTCRFLVTPSGEVALTIFGSIL